MCQGLDTREDRLSPRTELVETPWRSGEGLPDVALRVGEIPEVDVLHEVDGAELVVSEVLLAGYGQGVLHEQIHVVGVHERLGRRIACVSRLGEPLNYRLTLQGASRPETVRGV